MTTTMATKLTLSPVSMKDRKALAFRAGDTVRVMVKIREGEDKSGKPKFRLQAFEGMVLARKHGTEPGATFTIRKVSSGVGVERIFPLYSPVIGSIDIIKQSKVRRSKLYYIRDKAMRDVRRKMKQVSASRVAAETGSEEVLPQEETMRESGEKTSS